MNRIILIIFVITIPTSVFAQTGLSPVKEYFITCNPDSFNYIHDNTFEDHYIPITFTYQNKTWSNVRLRIRGDSSRELPKKSYKIKFDGEHFTNGREKINFNADYLDKSYLHSILASRLMKESGQPCFEAEPARLYLNGIFLGLYIRVENMDEDFLIANRFDPDGNLYKAARDGACLSIFDDVNFHWEKKTNKNADRNDLTDLIYKINGVTDSDYFNFASAHFDYEKMVNIIAMNMLIANGSTYYHNYYLYHDTAFSNRWTMFPWDLDLTFALYGLNYPYHRSSGYGVPDNPFLERAILCEPIFSDVKTRIDELHRFIFNSTFLFPVIDSLKSIIVSSVEQDTTDDIPNLTAWEQVIEKDKNFIAHRYSKLQSQFKNYPAPFRIERATDLFPDAVTLHWYPSTDPNGDPIMYTVKYSDRKYFLEDYTVTFQGIIDTFFTIPHHLEDGAYFWLVTATDEENAVDGFDSWNKFTVYSGSADLVIFNEINYKSAIDFDPKDWVELYNPHHFEIDISGWLFKDSDDAHIFQIPYYTRIKPTGYFVLCRNASRFHSLFPGVTDFAGDFNFGLSSDGELIRLFDQKSNLIDFVNYNNQAPWPTEPNGTGSTLELTSPFVDNSLPTNWAASKQYGTPARQNSIFAGVNREVDQNMSFNLSQNYPNPFNHVTRIMCRIPEPGDIEMKIYNIDGQSVKTIQHKSHRSGMISLVWEADNLSSGIYFYQLRFNKRYSPLKKAILLK